MTQAELEERQLNPRYASGGGVTAGEAKKIAERTVGEHVKYPAPKGHSGLGQMIAKRRG
jgi:hypothetical protein